MGKGEPRNDMAIFILSKLIYFSNFLYAFYGWFLIMLLFRLGFAKEKNISKLSCVNFMASFPIVLSLCQVRQW